MNFTSLLLNKYLGIQVRAVCNKSPTIIGALFILISMNHLNAIDTHAGSWISKQEYYKVYSKRFPNPIYKFLFKQQRNHKIAAALAFPFPFGGVGLHRVYLGTAAHVPLAYAATAGGVFGLIPLIDCFVLLTHKDLSIYENNSNIIMWIKHTAVSDSSNTSASSDD